MPNMVAAVLLLVGSAGGAVFSYNFSGNDGAAPGEKYNPCNILPGTTAGVVPANNWINVEGAGGGSYINFNTYDTYSDKLADAYPSDPNARLLNNYVETSGSGSQFIIATVPVTRCDVIIYCESSQTGEVADYNVNGQAQTVLTAAPDNAGPNFVLATPTTPGNYVEFHDVTGFVYQGNIYVFIYMSHENIHHVTPVDGFQIIDTSPPPPPFPEPIAIGFAPLAWSCLIRLRRPARHVRASGGTSARG